MLYECELVPKTHLKSWCWRWNSRWHRMVCCVRVNLYPRLTWYASAEGGPAGGTEPYAVWVWTCTRDLPDKPVLKVEQRVEQKGMLCECELVPKTYLISWCWWWTSSWHRPYAVWVWTCTWDLPDKLVLKVDQRVAQNGMLCECELVPKTYLISWCWRWTRGWHRRVCCVSVNLYRRHTW